MRYALVLVGIAALGSGVLPASAAPDAGLIAHCQSCHGDGAGAKPDAPRLNGLSADYLLQRLKAFAAPVTQSPHAIDNMWSVVVQMPDAQKRDLAAYFASLAAPKVSLSGPAAGRTIYQRGLPADKVAGCGYCHGASAEGLGTNPRLAGQKPEYLKMQLWAFNLTARLHGAMNSGAMKMTSEQIDALAAYLAGK